MVLQIQEFNCVHFWAIETPDGSTWLLGKCKRCGDEKKFRATPPTKKPIVPKPITVEYVEGESLEELKEEEAKQKDG